MALGRRWVAAVALVLVAGGCADDEPQPEFEPSAESSATASDTSSPDPAAKQPWEKKTEAGAVAFAKHWVDVFSTAVNSGTSEPLRRISAPACTACEAIVTRIDSIAADGGYYETPGWRVVHAVPSDGSPVGKTEVVLRVHQGKEKFKESADSKVMRNPSSRATYSAVLEWQAGAWLMSDLAPLS